MNCLECRRLLLVSPSARTDEQAIHNANCEECTRLAAELAALDRKILKATRLPIPEGLAERVVLAQSRPARWHVAAAAAAAILLISSATLLPVVFERDEPTVAADAVGPAHPALAAIAMVIDQEPKRLKESHSMDPVLIEERLKRLGLVLKKHDISVQYVGTCEIAGQDCDHLVLVTPEGHVSVVLMAHEHASSRVLVADRRMAALLSPAPSGAYIVVAESPKAARRAQKLFVRG